MTEAIKNSDEPSTQMGALNDLSAASGEESLFCRRIDFHLARKPFTGFSNGNGDFRLETLNPSSQKPGSNQVNGPLPFAKKIPEENGLDPELSLEMTFRKIVRIGAGLENLGNTCFLNSVLQCLTYTEPLAAYLQSGKHQVSCRTSGFCALCAIQRHVSRALQSTGRILSPKELVSNLRCISRNFRNSRQEDAHEYMVNFLEAMHKCCLPAGVPSGSQSAYQKSLIHKIFGGRLRSQVKCMQCNHCSDTFDPFLDLSLEINKADSVYKALANFTAKEQLDGGERHYQCECCKQKVRALKQLTIHKAPDVLIVHLKRFGSHHQGQKIDKKVIFAPNLDLKPFVTGSYDGDMKYNLFGVLVHAGWSTHSGHYFSFVRTSSGMWYNLDDNRVVQVNEKRVLDQKAYMLFYTRERKDFAPKKPIQILPKENMVSINGSIEKKNPPLTNINRAIINKSTTPLNGLVKIQSNSSVLITQLDSSKKSSLQGVNESVNKGLSGQENVRHLAEGKIVNVVPVISNGNASGNMVTEKTMTETGKPCSEKSNIDLHIEQSNCSGLQKSATDVSLENGLKASHPNVLVKDLEKVEPSCQIEDIIERNLSSDLMNEKADGKGQESADSVPETAQISTRKSYKNDPDSKPNQMRIKKHCTRTTMHLSASILFASLKHKNKKNKRTRKIKLGFKNLKQEPDLGPSTSEKISPTLKRKGGFNPKKENNIVKTADMANPNGVVATANEEFSNANCQTGAVLDAVDVKRQKICSNGEVIGLKDEKNNSKQNGLLNILTRGLDDTIVKGWDEMESYPLIRKDESNGVKNLTIGYIGDEWDEEYDRGKRKKIRGIKNSFGGPNPFQEIATSKENFKKAKLDHATSANRPFRIK